MMEFTYDGMVRWGFGFYNPNHAAALICACLPFLWGWRRLPWLGWATTILLAIPLAMTYSRTGISVAILELAAYFLLTGNRNWKLICGAGGTILIIAAIGGVLSRFTLDRAITNRPEIWFAGLKLYAANPMGVGLGNSGMLASTFLLDDIRCRTLINSHLTLLTEFGIFIGFLWCFMVIYALIRGTSKPRTWCAFAGLGLSASMASVFDWDVLFDFHDYGYLSLSNFILSWLTLLLFFGMGIYLALGKTNWKRPAAAAASAAVLLLLPFIGYSSSLPTVRDAMVIKNGSEMPLVLYDDSWTIKDMLPFLKNGFRIPLHPGNYRTQATSVWLFGNAAEYSRDFPDGGFTFVAPPEFFNYPEHTEKVFVKYFQKVYDLPEGCEVEYY